MLNRLVVNWVYGGFLAGLLLLLVTPVLARNWPPALLATFLCLPAYILHQYEEHDNDRFREYFNKTFGKGREILSPMAVFLINVPGVWGVTAVSFWLAAVLNPGFGLMAAYLLLLNAVIHIVSATISRGYNPGLVTAVLLFVPLGGICIVAIQKSGFGSAWMHLAGVVAAVGIHAAIAIPVAYVARSGANRSGFTSPAASPHDLR
ncbi:MAG: HXXEE domain-containing protein [Terracidiphilus sp.]|jgi:hypothetical protein